MKRLKTFRNQLNVYKKNSNGELRFRYRECNVSREHTINQEKLLSFLDRAGKGTYAGNGKRETSPERAGFVEFVYQERDLSYRDSYTGYYRSRGMEIVRYKDTPIWTSMYGGGMTDGNDGLADECFTFLKQALKSQGEGFVSFRGAHIFEDGDWKHTYEQEGDVWEFSGYEEIFYKEKAVFFHRIIGGVVEGKEK